MMNTNGETTDDNDDITNKQNNDDDKYGDGQVQESTIRLMTRLAIQYNAINLSQGFPNEPPPNCLRLQCAWAILQGQGQLPTPTPSGEALSMQQMEHQLQTSIMELLSRQQQKAEQNGDNVVSTTSLDEYNQYSPPMGRPDLRFSVAAYYKRFYDYDVSPDTNITITLGATEAFASALRSTCRPGDKVVIFEPFHELYPSQCRIFYLEPTYVTLRPTTTTTTSSTPPQWEFDPLELQTALKEDRARALLLNTPHNPTGKVFNKTELRLIVDLCLKYDIYLITDDIYEHILWQDPYEDEKDNDNNKETLDQTNETVKHWLIPKLFPEISNQTLVCNSLGKSASATGWRIGWCIHPTHLSATYRGIHDQLAVMAPHPMQLATLSYLTLPNEYFVDLAEKYRHRVQTLAAALTKLKFEVIPPNGAYYLFVKYTNVPRLMSITSSMDAAMYLLKEVGVASVPGYNFYGKSSEGDSYLRFAACRSDNDIEQAVSRLNEHLG